MNHFLNHYTTVTVPKLKESFSYASEYTVPKVSKVVINVGVGDIMSDSKAVESVSALVARIAGQRPMLTKARISIAGFKIRDGMTVGMKVTLRGTRMHDFLSKLIQISLPRTRDFRGLKPSAITADGNLNIGIKDSTIFPEAGQDVSLHGLQITLVSNAKTKEEAELLYTSLGFVFNSEPEVTRKK